MSVLRLRIGFDGQSCSGAHKAESSLVVCRPSLRAQESLAWRNVSMLHTDRAVNISGGRKTRPEGPRRLLSIGATCAVHARVLCGVHANPDIPLHCIRLTRMHPRGTHVVSVRSLSSLLPACAASAASAVRLSSCGCDAIIEVPAGRWDAAASGSLLPEPAVIPAGRRHGSTKS